MDKVFIEVFELNNHLEKEHKSEKRECISNFIVCEK
jgi:hypothetical protein